MKISTSIHLFINLIHRLATEMSETKICDSILWELVGSMEFTVKSIIYFIATYVMLYITIIVDFVTVLYILFLAYAVYFLYQ